MNFFWNVASAIVSGVAHPAFFSLREHLFPIPDVTGTWHIETCMTQTTFNPYKGMTLRYTAMILREGARIKGTAEKVYEHSSTGEREYVGMERTRAVIVGHIENIPMGDDNVSLHVVEDGHGRESTYFYSLALKKDGSMRGHFYSMAANSEGVAVWQRIPFIRLVIIPVILEIFRRMPGSDYWEKPNHKFIQQ